MKEERIGKYRVHPVAAMFPLLEGELYQEFKDSIQADGQIEPIIVQRDLLIDGRNRLRACLDLGIEPRLKEYIGTLEISRYITLKNLERRDLSPDQRISVLTKTLGWHIKQEAQQRKMTVGKEGRGHKKKLTPTSGSASSEGAKSKARHDRETAGQIAAEAHVSRYKAEQAMTVQKILPDLTDQVIAGTMTLNDAAKKAKTAASKRRPSIKKKVHESEIEFLEQICSEASQQLKEAGVISGRSWNVENSSKMALAEGLNKILHLANRRMDLIRHELVSQSRPIRQKTGRTPDNTPKIGQGAFNDSQTGTNIPKVN